MLDYFCPFFSHKTGVACACYSSRCTHLTSICHFKLLIFACSGCSNVLGFPYTHVIIYYFKFCNHNPFLGQAWASPTLVWLHFAHVCVSMLACLDWPLTVNFKSAHSNISQWWNVHTILYFSRENKRKATLPDCMVGVRESKSEDYSNWMHWQHSRQLTFWTMVRVWRSCDKAGCDWQSDSRVYASFSYMHGMTTHTLHFCISRTTRYTKMAVCLCGHSKYNLLLIQAHPRVIQHLTSIQVRRESVDCLCRDGAGAQYMQYLSKRHITSLQMR